MKHKYTQDTQPYDPQINGFVFFKNIPKKRTAWGYVVGGFGLLAGDIAILAHIAPTATVGELFIISSLYLVAASFVVEAIRRTF